MSARPIWGSDPELRAALAAGWRRSDLWWERLQERANRDWAAGDRTGASRRFLAAYWLGRLRIPRDDPRFATGLANAGLAARARGSPRMARARYEAALALWSRVPAHLHALEIRPRTRSSLFHLRIAAPRHEARHARTQARLAAFVAEAEAALRAIAHGEAAPVRLHSRWRGEKPAVFDDARKMLAACLLIAPEHN